MPRLTRQCYLRSSIAPDRLEDECILMAGQKGIAYGDGMKQRMRDGGLASADIRDTDGYIGPVVQGSQPSFAGIVMGAANAEVFAADDMFALPSHSDDVGMSVAGVMACRLPLAVSEHVAVSSNVAVAVADFVATTSTASAEHGLSFLLHDTGRRLRMCETRTKLICARCAPGEVGRDMFAEYGTVLGCTMAVDAILSSCVSSASGLHPSLDHSLQTSFIAHGSGMRVSKRALESPVRVTGGPSCSGSHSHPLQPKSRCKREAEGDRGPEMPPL